MAKAQLASLFFGLLAVPTVFARAADKEFDVSRHLGSKSPYHFRNGFETPTLTPVPHECKLEQVQLIGRHGTRNPSVKEILSFDALVSFFRQNMNTVNGHQWIANWTNPFIPEDNNLLAPVGVDELYWIGRRAKQRYHSLFGDEPYSPHVYKFRSSTTSRTGMSGSAFAGGFFEGAEGSCKYQSVYQYTIPQTQDYELMPKWACPNWQTIVGDDPFLAEEVHEWVDAHMPDIVARVRAALTRPQAPELAITAAHIKAIYRACAFEVSAFDRKDTWCTILTPNEVRLLEYLDDMEHYWDLAYGYEFNRHAGCALATDIVNEMRDMIDGRSRTKGVFRFGHAETNVFLMDIFGLYYDESHLFANSTEKHLHDRKFRLSEIMPFAGNWFIELYGCGDSKFVRVLLNEQEEVLPGCQSSLCPYETFLEVVGDDYGCDFKDLCGLTTCEPDAAWSTWKGGSKYGHRTSENHANTAGKNGKHIKHDKHGNCGTNDQHKNKLDHQNRHRKNHGKHKNKKEHGNSKHVEEVQATQNVDSQAYSQYQRPVLVLQQ
ncbi:PHOsphatase [Gaertneriomyces sp. JEL0708]|nr:PHOsphatase [Gaertneriomyces sp. JEL0708]